MNPALRHIILSGGVAAASWNAADKNANITLSTTNKTDDTAAGTATEQGVRSTLALPASAKTYFEVKVLTTGGSYGAGVATSAATIAGFWQNTTNNSWCVRNDAYGYFHGDGTPLTAANWSVVNNTLGVAVDTTAGSIWFRDAGGYAGDPGAGTGADDTDTGLTGTIYAIGYIDANLGSLLIVTDSANFAFAVPSGFSAGF